MRKPYGKVKSDSARKALRRKLSIRKKITGTTERPRLCTTRSNKHIRVQVVDDTIGKTLFSVQTYGKNAVNVKCNKDGGKEVGQKVGALLKEKNITTAVFDRNGNVYAGVMSSVADGVREAGITI